MKRRVVCFGDSNTWGLNAKNGKRFPEDVRWTGILAQMLGEDWQVIEEGQNGRTCMMDDVYEGEKNGSLYLVPCVESHDPMDLLVIMLGTNDIKTRFSLSAMVIADGLGRMLEKVYSFWTYSTRAKRPRILIIAPIHLGAGIADTPMGHLFGNEEGIRKSEEFAPYYEAIAGKYGCEFLDAARFAGAGKTDSIHLDEEGHRNLALAVYDKVKEIFGE